MQIRTKFVSTYNVHDCSKPQTSMIFKCLSCYTWTYYKTGSRC